MFDAQDEEEGTQGPDVAMVLLKTNQAIHLDAKLQNVLLLWQIGPHCVFLLQGK